MIKELLLLLLPLGGGPQRWIQLRERETFITELGEGRKTTLKGELKLRKAKATTLGIVLHARSCAMGGGDVVGEVKGVEEVGV